MSISQTQYVILGARFDFYEFRNALQNSGLYYEGGPFDLLEEYADHSLSEDVYSKDGISLIADVMNGDYVFLGMVGAKSAGGCFEDIIECDELVWERDRIRRQIDRVLKKYNLNIGYCFGLYVFTHFS